MLKIKQPRLSKKQKDEGMMYADGNFSDPHLRVDSAHRGVNNVKCHLNNKEINAIFGIPNSVVPEKEQKRRQSPELKKKLAEGRKKYWDECRCNPVKMADRMQRIAEANKKRWKQKQALEPDKYTQLMQVYRNAWTEARKKERSEVMKEAYRLARQKIVEGE